MISDLLKDLNVDCNFTNDIQESKYVENIKNDTTMNTSNKQTYYPTFIKCIISEFDPIYGSLSDEEKKLYFSKKIMEICSEIDECDESFKNYNFHKSLKSHKVQQGLQLHDKRINHISSLYYLNEYYKRHFVIVYENIAYPTCIKNYPKIYLRFDNHKVKVLNGCDFPEINLKNLFEKTKLIDDVKRDIKGIYNLYLEAISKYKLDDLKKIALECNIDLKDGQKNKTKSILYDSINLYKLNL
tara:strand:+ start:2220 stop:2945 length:726 start_codon:yes stop_codon:yes gene_type:complete